MANQNGAKGNPASKRMMNPRRAERRKQSWLRSQRRKRERIQAAGERMERNLAQLAQLGFARRLRERTTSRGIDMQYESPSQTLRRYNRFNGPTTTVKAVD